ncbi:MAG TPA: CHAT domain-containing protein [Solirubrobacteraceae bacterium]|nr:CHAT domain-containing protein [Solirubrobacteraceae bacterium]
MSGLAILAALAALAAALGAALAWRRKTGRRSEWPFGEERAYGGSRVPSDWPPEATAPGDRVEVDIDVSPPPDDEPRKPRRIPFRPQPPRAVERYANVDVVGPGGEEPPRLGDDRELAVLVDIGPLDEKSDVVDPVPFPDHQLPRTDLELQVLFSSTDAEVREAGGGKWRSAVESSLILPADGGPGDRRLRFELRVPDRAAQVRARLSYLYRNTIVQSQRVDLSVAADDRTVEPRVTTDFTLSQRLGPDLSAIRERPRVTIVANHAAAAEHQVAVRVAGPEGKPIEPPESFAIGDQRLGPAVLAVRKRLDASSPTQRKRRRRQLVQDLRDLASLGYDLYTALSEPIQFGVKRLAEADDTVVQVVLPRDSGFTLPWSFVYDIYLDSTREVHQVPVCKLVEDWDETSPLVGPGARRCPHDDGQNHLENLLCPFGFWGLRSSFELLTSAERPKVELRFPAVSRIVVGETEQIDRRRLDEHLGRFEKLIRDAVRGAEVTRAARRDALREAIEPDLPLLYFLCHGDRQGDTTRLSIGKTDRIAPGDLDGWMSVARQRTGRKMWTQPQPLVFVNACGSLAITPRDLTDYVTTFIGKGGAAGLIGTEVRVNDEQAMALAETFFATFLRPGATVDDALRAARTEFLADGNLLGLFYTAYCFADLQAVFAAP